MTGYTLLRLNADGSADPSLSVALGFSSSAEGLILDPSTRETYVLSKTYTMMTPQVALVKYSSVGVLDSTFATSGSLVLGSSSISTDVATFDSLNHRILVFTGTSSTPMNPFADGFSVYAINTDGSLDSDFGTSGVVSATGIVGATESFSISQIKVDEAVGRILLLGNITSGGFMGIGASASRFHLRQLNMDGSADTAFGTAGILEGGISDKLSMTSMQFTADHRLFLGGSSITAGASMFPGMPGMPGTTLYTPALVLVK